MVLTQGVSWLWLHCFFYTCCGETLGTLLCLVPSSTLLLTDKNQIVLISYFPQAMWYFINHYIFFLTDEEDPLMWFEVGVCDWGTDPHIGPCGTADMPLREEWHLSHSILELLWAALDPVRELVLLEPMYLVYSCNLAIQCADCFCMGSKLSRRTVLELVWGWWLELECSPAVTHMTIL